MLTHWVKEVQHPDIVPAAEKLAGDLTQIVVHISPPQLAVLSLGELQIETAAADLQGVVKGLLVFELQVCGRALYQLAKLGRLRRSGACDRCWCADRLPGTEPSTPRRRPHSELCG